MRKILTCSFILITVISFAQSPVIDSLQQVLKDFETKKTEPQKDSGLGDTSEVKVLNELSTAYCKVSDYASAKRYVDEALLIAKQLKFKKGMAASHNIIGIIYQDQGDYAESLKSYFAALKLREELGDKKGIATAMNNIGLVYHRQGNYPEALKNFSTALKLREEMGNKKGIASTLNNIGLVYNAQGNYTEALKNYYAALKIDEETGEKYYMAADYINIGGIYHYRGNYTEALENYLTALKLMEESGNKRGIASTYNNIGLIYKEQTNYSEALKNLTAALKLSEEVGDKSSIATAYSSIGSLYYKQGNYPEVLRNQLAALNLWEEIGDTTSIAMSYTNIGATKLKMQDATAAKNWMIKGLNLANAIGNLDQIKECYENLAVADSALGNFSSAFENHKMFMRYRDSLINEENIKKLTQQQMQYDFDKKESLAKAEQEKKDALAARELQKQKLLRNGFVGGFTVVLLFAGIFFTQRNTIQKGKKRSDELLLNILPSEVAEELKQNGSSEAKQFDEVTVMFTDFKNFTQVSEKLSPVELVSKIDYCYKAFDRIMEKYHIEKIKTIGDSYMAAGGLHFRNKSNVADVVKAALEIQEFIEKDGQQKRSEGQETMEIRIGIHTGPVVAGIVGVKKFAYDIWGDTVNIASRMESSGEPGKVNISETTYELVKDEFTCTYRGKIHAKNKGEIDMYFAERTPGGA